MADKLTLEEIRRRLQVLPIGYLSRKNIGGKIRIYHQWKEDGKMKSKYLKEGEEILLEQQINERKHLQEMERKLIKNSAPTVKTEEFKFNTNVIMGDELLKIAEGVSSYQKRDCYSEVTDYLKNDVIDKVAIIYGLRRTGKTTMIRQAILDMSDEELSKTVYIKVTKTDTIKELNNDMKLLSKAGYKYVFIDEITLMEDFIESASLFSDIYAAMGMKIVLSGTDSLGFWCSKHDELYDRAIMVHTTYIPYGEHSRLLGISDIDEYIRYGGTLKAGEIDFDDKALNANDASFKDNESTRRYVDTAISKNIQHSLSCYKYGTHLRHLQSLYDAGELTNAINRIVEDMNHRFLISVIEKEFKSNDLRLARKNLRKESVDVIDEIDEKAITQRLMDILDIRNKEDLSIGIKKEHIYEIKEYLAALDLIAQIPIETAVPDGEAVENTIFIQPGMRYCQAQALVHSLMKDSAFVQSSEYTKELAVNRILDEVKGRMLEDIVLYETSNMLPERYKVFKLSFAFGEFDMVIYDKETNTSEIFEVKHSTKQVDEQYKHLTDSEKCEQTERRFGKITNKTVLYRGEDMKVNGIEYRNVEEYLSGLYQQTMCMTEEQSQGFNMSM